MARATTKMTNATANNHRIEMEAQNNAMTEGAIREIGLKFRELWDEAETKMGAMGDELTKVRRELEAANQTNNAKVSLLQSLESRLAQKEEEAAKDKLTILQFKEIEQKLRQKKDQVEQKLAVLENTDASINHDILTPPASPQAKTSPAVPSLTNTVLEKRGEAEVLSSEHISAVNRNHKDNILWEFRRVCKGIAGLPGMACNKVLSGYIYKSAFLSKWFSQGSRKDEFEGDMLLWVRLLHPGVVKRVYNMRSRQLVKLFSRIFGTDEKEMVDDLSEGDVAETIGKFFEQSKTVTPLKKSQLGLHQVFLEQLAGMIKEEEQQHLLSCVTRLATVNDLKMFVRIMKSGAKHIIDGVHPDAFDSFNSSRNLEVVIDVEVPASSSIGLGTIDQVITPPLNLLIVYTI